METRITRIVEQIEAGVSSRTLVETLQSRETERADLRRDLAAEASRAAKREIALPDPALVYAAQVRRLEDLLGAPEHVVEANELLGKLVGRVVVRPDPEAPEGLGVELRGDLGWIVKGGQLDTQKARHGAGLLDLGQISVVAGAGFEPATFRL